jgi:putative DNA primase/helicase
MLTGSIMEQELIMMHGAGANGKSVMTTLIQGIMGDYAATVQFETLTYDPHKSGSGPTPDLARLVGARGVFAEEPEVGVRISEGLVKQLTGGSKITVRKIHKEPFEFVPTFKICLSFNNKPNVRGQDHGIWRRLNIVPWKASIPKEDQDKELAEKLLANEGSGILNWMIAGFQHWARGGLQPPDEIFEATDEYKAEMDPLGTFLSDHVIESPSAVIRASEFYGGYKHWCEDNSIEPLKQTAFGRKIADKDLYQKGKNSAGNIIYKGITLTPELMTLPDEI